jgi:PII-like signaling protein
MLEVTIFLDSDDLHDGQHTHEYIMRFLMHNQIKGASVFTAKMGYGVKHHLHNPRKLGNVDEEPLMIVFIDDEERVRAVLPHLKDVVKEGLIVTKNVERA